MKTFLKPNKFKVIFFLIFIIVTLLVFVIGDVTRSDILESIYAILYFPAVVFIYFFMRLTIFKTCSISFGEEFCIYDQTIPVIVSIPIFLIYVYLLASTFNIFINKLKK